MPRNNKIETPETVKELSEDVAAACKLWEGPQGVIQVLLALMNEERLATRDLAREGRLPLPVVAAIKNELQKRNILRSDGSAVLSDIGRDLLHKSWGTSKFRQTLCPTCYGRGHRLPPGFPELVDKITNYYRNRPKADVKLDQSQAEPETSLLRAAYMLAKGGILGRRVLFLGDDDLVSMATALWVRETVGPAALANLSLTVVDADERYLEFINTLCEREKFEITTVHQDLREPFPEDFGEYDTFETDPPYTLRGCELFVSRAIEVLVKNGTGMGFLCFGQSRIDLLAEVQQSLAAMSLAMMEIIPDFNRYKGASILANSSALLRLHVPFVAKSIIKGTYEGKLYTRDYRGHPKTYRCMACKGAAIVGPGRRFQTIEELKEVGCPQCGEKKFKAYG